MSIFYPIKTSYASNESPVCTESMHNARFIRNPDILNLTHLMSEGVQHWAKIHSILFIFIRPI